MPTLGELQALFTRALLQDDTTVASAILGDGCLPPARLALYRHHVLSTLTEVLKAAFPVLCRLVDARFFAYVADQYIRQQPPTGPCLFEYGASLPAFLATCPACRDLVYLPDVACLEWALHSAWYAEDAAPLDPERLRGVAPDDLGSLTLTCEPSVSYVRSPWPIDRIWRANQPDAAPDETVPLDAGAAYLEVRRLDDEVLFRALAFDTFMFRATLAAGRTLAEAFEVALATAPDFDLTAALQTLFAEGLVVDAGGSAGKPQSTRPPDGGVWTDQSSGQPYAAGGRS
jgi:hypothetical protein